MNKILKNGLLWFAAGALFAAAANVAAPLMVAGEIATLAAAINPVWLGTMMAGATMIATALEPFMDGLLGKEKTATVAAKDESPQVHINISQAPELSQGVILSDNKFQQNLQAQRNEAEKMLVIS